MTDTVQTPEVTATVHSRASLEVRALVLPRAEWESEVAPNGRRMIRPLKATWHAHVARGRSAHDVTVCPMVGCPNCGGLLLLTPTRRAAEEVSRMVGQRVPEAHAVDSLGKVSPDLVCTHGRCDFHRKVYLDRWQKTKPLFALAYVNLSKGEHGAIEIAYSHSVDVREARHHLGRGNFRVIAGGPAIGFFVDEKTGRVTAD